MPFVPELRINIGSKDRLPETDDGFLPQILALHDIFAAFPSLESLSVSINFLLVHRDPDYSDGPETIGALPLSPAEDAIIPPLQSLSLSGYATMREDMEAWKTKVPWHTLRSLKLGPQENINVYGVATGKVHNLRV